MATPEHYEETFDPKNPPNSLEHVSGPSTSLYWYAGSIVLVLVLISVVAVFWLASHPAPPSEALSEKAVGASGYATDGGHNPVHKPRNTRDELKFRGF